MTRLPDELGHGQAAVLASIIRHATNGPAHIADIAADTGLRRSTIRQHLARLDALDVVHPWLDRGHDLACWCPLDQPCHADVLLELANGEAA